jgi:hypothetical protein
MLNNLIKTDANHVILLFYFIFQQNLSICEILFFWEICSHGEKKIELIKKIVITRVDKSFFLMNYAMCLQISEGRTQPKLQHYL